MLKKWAIALLAIMLVLAMFPTGQQAEAANTYTFVKAQYNETEAKDGTVTRTLTGVTLKKSNGKTGTFQVANTNKYYINNTLTTITGFKNGMTVTIKVKNNKITEIRGTTNDEDGSIVANSKQLTGTVTTVDPNGLQIRVKADGSSTKTYTVTSSTEVFKGNSSVDLSTIYVGDRVRLKFETATTSRISEINIISTAAILVEDLYKASLKSVNTSKNTMIVKNSHPLTNWYFGKEETAAQKTFTYSNNTSFYVGSKKITEAQLKKYTNNTMYFVTKKQFSKEVVDKIIVLASNERTYYLPITEVSTSVNRFTLNNTAKDKLAYHAGSILIRNGRLVDPEGLIALNLSQEAISTTAYVVTDGTTKSTHAHVVNITNDSSLAPNLSKYQLYFGRIDVADIDAYQLELTDLEAYKGQFWNNGDAFMQFAFSNSTTTTIYENNNKQTIETGSDLDMYDNEWNSPNPYYGYFYVKDGHIQGIHFVPDENRAQHTYVGRVDSVNQTSGIIIMKNVSRWDNSGVYTNSLANVHMNSSKAMIVKNGKVIQLKDIKVSDHITAISKGTTGYVLIVNE